MYLRSPDPTSHAVIHDGLIYPVREGVFRVDPERGGGFPSTFVVIDIVSAEVAAELQWLGNWAVSATDPGPSPRPPAVSSPDGVKPAAQAPLPPLLDEAAALRARASHVRAEIEQKERELQGLRDNDEAGKLDKQAAGLEWKQALLDRVADLRAAADRSDEAAATLTSEVAELDAEIHETEERARAFDAEIEGGLEERRSALQEKGAIAAAAGDSQAIMSVETETAFLPNVEARLREQVEASWARALELNDRAAHLEARADEERRSARVLREHAESDDPLEAIADTDYLPPEQLARGGGRTLGKHLVRRRAAALARSGVQLTPDRLAQL